MLKAPSPLFRYGGAAAIAAIYVWPRGSAPPPASSVAGIIVGLVSAALIYVLASRLFRNRWSGLAAAGIFALTPLQFVQSEQAAGPYGALPFVIGWLLCVVRFSEGDQPVWLIAGGAILAGGLFSHHASLVMMPVYLVLTIGWLLIVRGGRATPVAMLLAGFGVAAIPAGLFIGRHAALLRTEITRLGIYDANRFNPLQGAREVGSWIGLTARTEVYYDYFNPVFLLFSKNSFVESLRQPQVLLLPLAVLLPVGFYDLMTVRRAQVALLVVCGFLAAPCAAALPAEPYVARRILFIVPFAAIIAACGLEHLVSSGARAVRFLGFATLAAIPVCFAFFYAAYLR